MAQQGSVLAGPELAAGDDRGDIVTICEQLHRAGWSIGDVVLPGEGGGTVWVVLGRRGDDLMMASGATRLEAWRGALGRASAAGTSPGWSLPSRG
jgi:hypothetical protein